jgi:hypothetical protein
MGIHCPGVHGKPGGDAMLDERMIGLMILPK